MRCYPVLNRKTAKSRGIKLNNEFLLGTGKSNE